MANNEIEVIFLGNDNEIELQLSSQLYSAKVSTIIDHSQLIRVAVTINTTTIDSLETPDAFDLTNDDRLILKFGQLDLSVGNYLAKLIVFDNQNPNGMVWGFFNLLIT